MGQDWRVNCKPAFHPTRQHLCSTAARPAPLPVWAELCTAGAPAPGHTSSSPHRPSPAERSHGPESERLASTPRPTQEVSAQPGGPGPRRPAVRLRAADPARLRRPEPASRATRQPRPSQGLRPTAGRNREARVQLAAPLQLHGGSRRLVGAC